MGQHGKSYRSPGTLGVGECCEFIVLLNGPHSDWSRTGTLEIESLRFKGVCVRACVCVCVCAFTHLLTSLMQKHKCAVHFCL